MGNPEASGTMTARDAARARLVAAREKAEQKARRRDKAKARRLTIEASSRKKVKVKVFAPRWERELLGPRLEQCRKLLTDWKVITAEEAGALAHRLRTFDLGERYVVRYPKP